MVLQHLWTALPFIQSEDTFSFHAKLFRCFLLSFLDAYSDPAFVSQGSQRILTVFRQLERFVDVRLDDPISHRVHPFGRHNNAIMRCPPRSRYYDATSLPSFVATSMAVPLASVPRFVNVTDVLYEAPTHSAVASGLPGSPWSWFCA